MGWLELKRVPEPEVMDADLEVEAYASAAAQGYLASIDTTFVEHVGRLLPAALLEGGCSVFDLGCGPGQIPILLARRWPGLQILAVDAAPAMVERARQEAAAAGVEIDFEVLRLGPEGAAGLPYPDASFELVTCNSVLHHLADPLAALDELARVAKPEGAVLVKDLRRPPAFAYALHVRVFGRHYRGEMRRLFEASVRAAYTPQELRAMLRASRLDDGRARVFQRGLVHAGIERPALAR